MAIRILNKTGSVSVKGTLVKNSTGNDNAFDIMDANGVHPIGAVYEDGIADGLKCWVVIEGIVEVLLEDTTASQKGYWAKVSDNDDGRSDCSNANPPAGGAAELQEHMTEIGHCLETKTAGTNVLCKILMHFN